MREIRQTRQFKTAYKKMYPQQKKAVDSEVRKLALTPEIGVAKKQDLRGVMVHKFMINDRLYLLAYSYDPVTLMLILLGVHENFYNHLKMTLR